MRPALLGLLALAGCNEIWGLDDVRLRDGGFVDGDPKFPRIRLTSQIAKTNAQGYADSTLEYRALDPPPAIQIGPLDRALEAAEYGSDGTVKYPVEFTGTTWRLVYTLPGDVVPREVHWSPPSGDLVAHIVEPVFGRAERMPVPAGGGYAIDPMSSPAQHTLTRVFTTGIWTEGVFTNTTMTSLFNYNFGAKAQSLSGPLGAPEKAWSDHAVLADFQNLSGCRVSSGAAAFIVPDMVAGSLSAPEPQPRYYTPDKQANVILGGPDTVETRLQGLLGARSGGASLGRVEYGYVPSLLVFGFTKPVSEAALDFLLPGPRMITFANCTFAPTAMSYQTQAFALPPDLEDRFLHVVHVEVANQRMLGLAKLTSGFSAVVPSSSLTFTSEFLVAAPKDIRLHNGSQMVDLENDPDGTVLQTGSPRMELRFAVEQDARLAADSFDITLYSVASDKLDRQRVYTVTEPKLTLDPSFLVPGTQYVFEVRAYRGRPDITRANFAVNAYPQYSATIVTRMFRTP